MIKFLVVLAAFLGVITYADIVPSLHQQVPLGQVIQVPVAIPSAAPSPAAGINAHSMSLVGVKFPATLTSTTMTFKVSTDCSSYVPLYNSGGVVSYTVAASRFVAINPADFYGAACVSIVLGSSEAGARSLTAVLKGM